MGLKLWFALCCSCGAHVLWDVFKDQYLLEEMLFVFQSMLNIHPGFSFSHSPVSVRWDTVQ